MHIGLKLADMIFEIMTQSSSVGVNKFLTYVLKKCTNFRSIFVKNVQMSKNQLHTVALEVKSSLIKLLGKMQNSDETSKLCSSVLRHVFGPNPFS